MPGKDKNIFSILDQILQRKDKESLLNQRSKIIWLTGLSGSGKTTIAVQAEKQLYQKGYLLQLLDGDNIRTGINNNLGFTETDRDENIRRIAEVSKLFLECGIITINCFISPTLAMRSAAAKIIGDEDFLEVYINAPLEVCEARDVKGLYKKAREGAIENFTGIDAPFEPPKNPALEIRTDQLNEEESIRKLVDFILPHIELQ